MAAHDELPLCSALANGTFAGEKGLCMLCPPGSYRYSFGEECRSCPPAGGLIVQQIAALVWVGALLLLVGWTQVPRVSAGRTVSPDRAGAQVLPLVLGHTQLMAAALVVPWDYPAWVLAALELPAAFLGVDLLAMFQVDCSMGHSRDAFQWRWIVSQGSLIGVVLLLLVASAVASAMSRRALSDLSYHRAIVVYGIFLSAIVRGGAAIHDCVQHGDDYVIDHSPEIACDYDDSLYQVIALVSGATLQVSVLLPAIIWSKLTTKHDTTVRDGGLGGPSDVQKFGWLFTRYTHSRYWWEVLTMYKTTATICFAVWMSHSPGKCAGLVVSCLALQLVLQLMLQPMECIGSEKHGSSPAKRKGNQLQVLTIVCQLLFFSISMISAWTGPTSDDRLGTCQVVLASDYEESLAPTACGILDTPMFGDKCFQTGPCRGQACPAGHCKYVPPPEDPRSGWLNAFIGLLVFVAYVGPLGGGAALMYSAWRPGSDNSAAAGAGVGTGMRVPLSFDAENSGSPQEKGSETSNSLIAFDNPCVEAWHG